MLNTDNIEKEVVEFFYCFSRFEFSLKECGYLKNCQNAIPDWKQFVDKYENAYSPNNKTEIDINYLLNNKPKKQIVCTSSSGQRQTQWIDFDTSDKTSLLTSLTDIVKIVRNNLFHGGKYGEKSWDNRDRVVQLLQSSKTVIESFLELDNDLAAYYTNFS